MIPTGLTQRARNGYSRRIKHSAGSLRRVAEEATPTKRRSIVPPAVAPGAMGPYGAQPFRSADLTVRQLRALVPGDAFSLGCLTPRRVGLRHAARRGTPKRQPG